MPREWIRANTCLRERTPSGCTELQTVILISVIYKVLRKIESIWMIFFFFLEEKLPKWETVFWFQGKEVTFNKPLRFQ